MTEHRVQTPAPANAKTQAETHYFDDQLKRALRISSKIRNPEPLDILQFSGHSPEIGTYIKTEEFQRRMSDFMRDWRYGARRAKRSPITSPPLKIEHMRSTSRDRYGTPSDQVEEEIRRRQERLVHGQVSTKAAPSPIDLAQATARAKWQRDHPIEQNSEEILSVLPSIGRRSPKQK
ncbi:hypothetical protein [Streptomyces sp. NBC_00576]|uniref:hypothetical protein n=1 Tax=Streptomyces sp. NBC_00576 TaxID=2903665 RepID=UPI002E7FF7E7|nr:hypothetical protein [Streptomyces sp. NBC_00576]WUB69569.1 hypothetical protein OG734_05540 [Streptomyces sp. NBC_00576]